MDVTRRIFGLGETVYDVVFKHDRPMAAVPGGSAFNAIISLGRSVGAPNGGASVSMITEVGDDHIGDIILRFMHDNNVSTDCVSRNRDTQTHVSMAFLDDRNDAHYEFYKDHAHASLQPQRLEGLEFKADDVLLTSSFFSINPVIRSYTRDILSRARQAGAIIYYDVNFRRSHIADLPNVMANIIENMQLADIVRGSTEDFDILFGTSDPQQIYQQHVSRHCPVFICTDGGKPLTLITPTIHHQYDIQPITTVSTIGAGDNFNAGILCAIVNGAVNRSQLATGGREVWDALIDCGLQFSAEVCQSYYNYINR